ncbi:hypothetical protein RB597_002547 [Gaeumannomyces tritici]
MPLASHAVWPLLGTAAYLAAMAKAAGVLDFPFIWASQNDNLAKYLELSPEYRLFQPNGTKPDKYNSTLLDITSGGFRHWPADFGENRSDLQFFWTYKKLDFERPVHLAWSGRWVECGKIFPGTPDAFTGYSVNGSSNFVVRFELKKGGKKADLVAATTNHQECPDQGFTISVTGETNEVTKDYRGLSLANATCAVVDPPPSPTPTANPCRVKVDKSAAESIEAVILEHRCSIGKVLGDKPTNCPKKSHASRQLAVAGIATLVAVALGATGFLLA